MKKIFLTLSLMLASSLCSALTVTVIGKGTKSQAGSYRCLIFNSAVGFPKDPSKAKANQVGKIVGTNGECVFTGLVAGSYAVSTYHDQNNNNKLDTGPFGIPKEKYGFSNNATGTFGPPNYLEAVFTVSKDVAITINLK